MRNSMKKAVSFLMLAATAVSSFAACNGGGKGDGNKATLYVYSFTSGFGSEWLESLIADYEAEKANEEIDGKEGTQSRTLRKGKGKGSRRQMGSGRGNVAGSGL